MNQYLLSVYPGDLESTAPPPEEMEKIYSDVDAFNKEIQEAGAWVFAGGLHPASTATVVRVNGDEVQTTDGPFAEGKEHIGGFWVVKAADLDAALDLARRATRACAAPVEVRPFQEEASD
jgi:hypothetical protein